MFVSDYADHLTRIRFNVFVPDIATRNPRHVAVWGLEVPEDPKEAEQLRKKQALCQWTIAEILEWKERGVFIGIPKRSDMVLMCEYISHYLDDYKNYLAMNPDAKVSNQLRLVTGLEKLSKDLYSRLTKDEVAPPKQKRINGIGIRFVNPFELMKGEDDPAPPKPTYEDKYGSTLNHVLRMHLEREKKR